LLCLEVLFTKESFLKIESVLINYLVLVGYGLLLIKIELTIVKEGRLNMKRTKCKLKGSSNMKKDTYVIAANGEKVFKQGFRGFKGFSYHPTKGFKKVSDYKPD